MSNQESDLLERVERIAADVIARHASAVDREGRFPRSSVAALAEAGALGALSAPDVGGAGLGLAGAARVVERVARECGSTAMIVMMHYCGVAVLERHGPADVRREAAAGRHLSTLAFSEFGSRSHFWAPVSSARRAGDDVVLDARKSWVTAAHHASAYIWSSKPVQAEGASSLWLVPRELDGLAVEGEFDGLGLRGNDSAPVTATGVRIPASHRLGDDGSGFATMMEVVLPVFNILNASASVGLMTGALSRTIAHASGLKFEYSGAGLRELPTIRNYIARMQIKTDAARALVGDAIASVREGRDDAMLRILESKAAAGELSTEVLDLGMRVCGGAALRDDVGVERYFRDTRAAGVMAPTTDVLYDFIGKAVCGMEPF